MKKLLSLQDKVGGNGSENGGEQQILDPCLPQGFDGSVNGVKVSGGGYFSLCRQISSGLVAGNCTSQHCGLRGLQLPPLAGALVPSHNQCTHVSL